MILSSETQLLLITFVGVLGLIVLIARYKLHAFLALLLVSLAVGLASGMKLTDIAKAFQDGVGNTLGFIAVIVGIGTMLGKLLAESGGAEVIAGTFIRALGPRRLPIAMVIVAFVVGLPVFFGVGILLLAPIIFSLARETRLPLLWLALPMVAGLSTSHCLVPPHVGPMVAIERLGADVGKTILLSTAIGFPIALLVGLFYTKYITKTVVVASVETTSIPAGFAAQGRKPSFAMALFTIALPVLLMLGDTVAKLGLPAEHSARAWAGFFGSPIVSMFIAALFSFYSFGWACGFNRNQLLKFTEECVGPAASIMLVVGAGGGFSKVLDQAGVAKAIASLAGGLHLSPLLLGWLVAALIRVAVGSATVTITMTAAMLAPVADATPGTHRELLVIALGAGSLIASHLNDGGFWFVKEYFNMTVGQTLKTWTVLVSIVSVAALLLTLLVDVIL
ncbi:MAG TPA: gluconate:H+ symporter [Verrucomicrobiae bacterium]|nr:gluconate:H+ symporter [Verrucomicrobiae bacterium]